jgi:hypothetical protein
MRCVWDENKKKAFFDQKKVPNRFSELKLFEASKFISIFKLSIGNIIL